MKTHLITSALLCLLAAACGDANQGAPSAGAQKSAAPAATSAAAKATASAAPTAVAGAEEEIPTEADFEEEAEKEITGDTMVAELEKLEKEIGEDTK